MRRVFLRAVIALYPRRWRERYGQELQELLEDLERDDARSRAEMMLSLVAGAAEERVAALRASAFRTGTVVAVGCAGLAAVAFVTVSASGSTTGRNRGTELRASSGHRPASTRGAQVSYGNSGSKIEQQLQSDIQNICAQIAVGKRATAIELDPATGAVVAKVVQTCGSPA
jgi:hypothetical protein